MAKSELRLQPTPGNTIEMSCRLWEQVPRLLGRLHQKGISVNSIPEEIQAHLKTARRMHLRFVKAGLNYCYPSEIAAMNEIAQWAIETNATITGHPLPKTQWTPHGTISPHD